MKNIYDLFRRSGFHFLLFGLGIILFSWPFLMIAEGTDNHSLFLYLFFAWAGMILLLYIVAVSHARSDSDEAENTKAAEKEE